MRADINTSIYSQLFDRKFHDWCNARGFPSWSRSFTSAHAKESAHTILSKQQAFPLRSDLTARCMRSQGNQIRPFRVLFIILRAIRSEKRQRAICSFGHAICYSFSEIQGCPSVFPQKTNSSSIEIIFSRIIFGRILTDSPPIPVFLVLGNLD